MRVSRKGHQGFVRSVSTETARQIREERARGMSYPKLAETFSTTITVAWCICTGRTYKDAGGPVEIPRRRPGKKAPDEETVLDWIMEDRRRRGVA